MRVRPLAEKSLPTGSRRYSRLEICATALLAAVLALASGCGESSSHSHETEEAWRAPMVCGYKEGHGVFVGEETLAAIALRTAHVIPKREGGVAIPESSLLSTARGDFVFTVNGDHFQRTEVKFAGRADGWIAVSEGLSEGAQIVTNGVRELWRIELQATKGGTACCH